jgi:stage II sporulation protein D
VKILFEESGEIKSYSMKDYIIGAVFAQMPANFETEALKSQAVLASTYARRRIISESENPTDGLNGAHLSDDSGSYQAFFTEEQAVEAYGDDYEEAYDKISEAAEYAENRTLTYDGEPILTAFHGISYGATESALTMWGEDIPYLQSVDSNWDSELAQCETVVTFSESEMKQLLSAEFDGGDFSGEPQDWISIAEKSEGGTALKIRAGGELAESSRLCKILGLPSAHLSVSYSDGEFTCTSLGCGHLVGMSQYGANEMAKQGKSSEEILLHYFPYTIIISS